jgi:soluble lytic murein transglycosylase-like protein
MCLRAFARSAPRPARPAGRRGAGVAGLALFVAVAAHASEGSAIFQIDDTPGEIHLSDRGDAPAGVATRRLVGADVRADDPPPAAAASAYVDIVRAAARDQRLDPALLRAVIGVESGTVPRATSRRGAAGLMQLMPSTARAYGVTDIFDPRQNIDAGAKHLRRLLDRYGQDLPRALAAYNAGAAAIDGLPRAARWPNPETAAYVPRVLTRYAALRSDGPPAAAEPPRPTTP